MKKQMKRTVYEAPVTERFQVELEGTFMTASAGVTNGDPETGQAGINAQVVNDDFVMDFTIDDPNEGANVWD